MFCCLSNQRSWPVRENKDLWQEENWKGGQDIRHNRRWAISEARGQWLPRKAKQYFSFIQHWWGCGVPQLEEGGIVAIILCHQWTTAQNKVNKSQLNYRIYSNKRPISNVFILPSFCYEFKGECRSGGNKLSKFKTLIIVQPGKG